MIKKQFANLVEIKDKENNADSKIVPDMSEKFVTVAVQIGKIRKRQYNRKCFSTETSYKNNVD